MDVPQRGKFRPGDSRIDADMLPLSVKASRAAHKVEGCSFLSLSFFFWFAHVPFFKA
jgi:hypothetical protein